jgi:hypothetical protein
VIPWFQALMRFGRDDATPPPGDIDTETFKRYLEAHDQEFENITEIARSVKREFTEGTGDERTTGHH